MVSLLEAVLHIILGRKRKNTSCAVDDLLDTGSRCVPHTCREDFQIENSKLLLGCGKEGTLKRLFHLSTTARWSPIYSFPCCVLMAGASDLVQCQSGGTAPLELGAFRRRSRAFHTVDSTASRAHDIWGLGLLLVLIKLYQSTLAFIYRAAGGPLALSSARCGLETVPKRKRTLSWG